MSVIAATNPAVREAGLGAIKVLHVISSISPLRGGPSHVIRMLSEGLSDRGMCVHVATTDDNGPDRFSTPYRVPVTEGKVTYWYFPRQLRYYTCSLPLAFWLWRHLREFDLLHIHAVFSYPSTVSARIATLLGVPYIVRPLGVLNRWGIQNRRPFLKRLSFAMIEKSILQNAAAVQYTSEQEQLEAGDLYSGSNGVILPNPVRISPEGEQQRTRAQHGSPDKPLILFMSRLDQKKGLDLLIPAFAQVRQQFPGSRLIVAGNADAAFESSLRRLAENASVADAIDWVGFVSGAVKQELLARADVFVLPSYSENFGVAVVEAMAAGLPVVISDQTGIHPVITQHRAGLVTACSIPSVSAALIQILADPAGRLAMGERGRRVALTEFSISAVSEKLIDLYQSILSR
jgi:glycosyltransferase involved in cell wall biosynthesis